MSQARVITMHYTLTDKNGTILDSSNGQEPLAYLEDAGNIIPGLEAEIKKLNVGDKKTITVAAAEAYGEFRQDLVVEVPRKQFPSDSKVKVGDRFRTGSHSPVFTVLEVSDAMVKIDGNHPLAGQDLTFAVEIMEIRAASEEEISHGHVHGEHGHHH